MHRLGVERNVKDAAGSVCEDLMVDVKSIVLFTRRTCLTPPFTHLVLWLWTLVSEGRGDGGGTEEHRANQRGRVVGGTENPKRCGNSQFHSGSWKWLAKYSHGLTELVKFSKYSINISALLGEIKWLIVHWEVFTSWVSVSRVRTLSVLGSLALCSLVNISS